MMTTTMMFVSDLFCFRVRSLSSHLALSSHHYCIIFVSMHYNKQYVPYGTVLYDMTWHGMTCYHDFIYTVYWIHESKGYSKGKVEGNGGRLTLTTVLAHEWWVRDARTDTHRGHLTRNKLMDQTRLYHIKIVNDEVTEYVIPKRSCFDLSGHCSFWNKSGKECDKNPDFMHHICMLTCKKCEPDVDPTDDGNGNGNNNKDNNNGDKKSSSSSSDEL